MTEGLRRNLSFLISLPVEDRRVYLDLLAKVYPNEHERLMKELASRTVRGDLEAWVVADCPKCGRYHPREFCSGVDES